MIASGNRYLNPFSHLFHAVLTQDITFNYNIVDFFDYCRMTMCEYLKRHLMFVKSRRHIDDLIPIRFATGRQTGEFTEEWMNGTYRKKLQNGHFNRLTKEIRNSLR